MPKNSFTNVLKNVEATHGAEQLGDYPVTVGGEPADAGCGFPGLHAAIECIWDNPAFEKYRTGELTCTLKLTREKQDGRFVIAVAGIDLVAFEPDEASAARDAFQLIRVSDLAEAVETLDPHPERKSRRARAHSILSRALAVVAR